MTAAFTFFLFLFQGLIRFSRKDIIPVIIAFGSYCLIVGPFAQLIDTNFNNFVHSNAPFLENIRQSIINVMGAFFGQTVYVLIISAGTILVALMAYYFLKGLTVLLHQRKKRNHRNIGAEDL